MIGRRTGRDADAEDGSESVGFEEAGCYVLIDAGFPNRRDKLDAELAAAGCGPGELRLIVLTHGDLDHVGNCAHLRRTHRAPIAIHRLDADMVRRGDMGVGRKDKPDRQAPMFRFMTWAVGLLTKITKTGADFEAFEPDVLLEDGQDLSAYAAGRTPSGSFERIDRHPYGRRRSVLWGSAREHDETLTPFLHRRLDPSG